jgi:hypothetical protein
MTTYYEATSEPQQQKHGRVAQQRLLHITVRASRANHINRQSEAVCVCLFTEDNPGQSRRHISWQGIVTVPGGQGGGAHADASRSHRRHVTGTT